MKILESSKATAETWRREARCRCGTKVELQLSDLEIVSDDRDGNAVVWTCPDCREPVWHAISVVPAALHYTINRRK